MKMLEQNPDGVNKADIVVGIPSYNEAPNIAFPTEQAALGLKKYFGSMTAVIINSDNNSPDKTAEAFMATDTHGIPKLSISTPEGIKGRGNNFRNLYKKVIEMDAQALVVVDSDLTSITPMWIKNLGEPLFKDFGFVAPLYMRHAHDDMFSSTIVYPLTRALYGRRVKQPIGGDYGLSRGMINTLLKSNLWNGDVAQYGIDIWMTTRAMNEGIPICQAFLARPKMHRVRENVLDPGPLFRQVLSTIFDLMEVYHDKWAATKWSKPTAIFGFGGEEPQMPVPVKINREKLYQRFKAGFSEYWESYRSICTTESFQKLREIASLSMEHFEIPEPIWAKIMYDFALAFHHKTPARSRVLEVLVPLYIGMILSFANRTRGMSLPQADEALEDMCLHYEQTKPYLIDRWK